MLGAFQRVYLWHWLLLRGMVVTAAGLQTCVGAEWGQSCADFHPLQLARLLSTCIIDLQIFNVARSLLLLWRQAPELAASVSLSLTPTLTLTLTP